MPTHSPPAGHERDVAFDSGPRTVSNVPPNPFVTTISQWLIAIERNGPALSLCACQTRSMNGESDDLSSNVKIEFSVECNHTPPTADAEAASPFYYPTHRASQLCARKPDLQFRR